LVQGFGVIADDIEAAAFGWALRPERAHDDMAARLNGTRGLPNICGALFQRGKEMKNSPVVPYVIRRLVQSNLRNVRGQPVNLMCDLSQPLLGGLDRNLRNI
jgi:hypothetical protein